MSEFKTLTDEELDKATSGKNIVEIMTCLMSLAQYISDVQEAIELIKQNNIPKATKYLNELIQKGYLEIEQCIA